MFFLFASFCSASLPLRTNVLCYVFFSSVLAITRTLFFIYIPRLHFSVLCLDVLLEDPRWLLRPPRHDWKSIYAWHTSTADVDLIMTKVQYNAKYEVSGWGIRISLAIMGWELEAWSWLGWSFCCLEMRWIWPLVTGREWPNLRAWDGMGWDDGKAESLICEEECMRGTIDVGWFDHIPQHYVLSVLTFHYLCEEALLQIINYISHILHTIRRSSLVCRASHKFSLVDWYFLSTSSPTDLISNPPPSHLTNSKSDTTTTCHHLIRLLFLSLSPFRFRATRLRHPDRPCARHILPSTYLSYA